MTDVANAAIDTAEVPKPELKSTDTSDKAKNARTAPTEPKPEPKPKAEEPAKVEKTEVKPPEGDDAPSADAPEKKKTERLPRWVQERMERVARVTAAETREAVLRELQQQSPKPEAQAKPEPEAPAPKTLDDFDFDQGAYTAYLVQEGIKAEKAREKAEQDRKTQHDASEKFKARIDAFEERVGAGAWEDIVSSPINMDPALKPLADMFMGDEHDLDIAHWLATNPEELKRIADLPRLQQVREVAKLADKFSGDPEPEKPVKEEAPLPKKVTNAPPPAKTVSGAGKSPVVDIYDPGMTTEQRIKLMRKKG